MKHTTKIKLASGFAAFALLAATGCAPQYIMRESGIYGDHFVRKMLKPAGSSDGQQLSHYYVEICDVGSDGKAKECNVTLVMENLTNYTWNK